MDNDLKKKRDEDRAKRLMPFLLIISTVMLASVAIIILMKG
jgi:hypothetical protein